MSSMVTSPSSSTVRVYPSSCEPCRKRKSRCDRVKPCSNCVMRGNLDQCYREPPRIDGRKTVRMRRSRASRGNISLQDERAAGSIPEHPPRANAPVQPIGDYLDLSADPDRTHASGTASTPTAVSSADQSQLYGLDALVTTSGQDPGAGKAAASISLEEVSLHIPSLPLCLRFLSFFFDELVANVSFIKKEALIQRVTPFLQDRTSLSKKETSILFWLLAYASLAAPPKHALRSTYIDLHKSAYLWKELAVKYHRESNKESDELSALATPSDDPLIEVALYALQAMWENFHSNLELHWKLSGEGIRIAASLHLFSEVKPSWGMRRQGESRRQSSLIDVGHMVQKLLIMDRWIAFLDLRPLGIHPSEVTLPLPTFDTSDNLRACLEQVQIKLLEESREITLQSQSSNHRHSDVYELVRGLMGRIDEECLKAIDLYSRRTPVKLDAANCVKGASGEHAAVLLSWLASSLFISCCMSMRFFHDGGAPGKYALLSFWKAQELLALSPSIHAIQQEGRQALRLTRLAKQIFLAIRIIFMHLAAADVEQHFSAEGTGTESAMFGLSNLIPYLDPNFISGISVDATSPQLQMHFHSAMDLLQGFSVAGCKTATEALSLTERVLQVNSTLRSKLNWGRQGTPLDLHTRYTLTRADQSEDLDAAASLRLLQDTNGGGVSSNTSHYGEMPFLLPAMWQLPEIDMISNEEIERILSAFTDQS